MLKKILEILEHSNLFLTGGGGVGKSYLTQAVVAHYKKEFKNVVILGSTGISAVNVGGVSVHSFFKFGISSNFDELRMLDMKQKSALSKVRAVLDSCDLLIIDEISMISAQLLDMVYYRLRASKFIGRVMLVGDFYQLPPVKKQAEQSLQNSLFSADILNFTYAFNSRAWQELELVCVELTHSKRTDDAYFYEILSKLRVGELDESCLKYLNNLRQNKIVLDSDVSVLFGRNKESQELNNTMLNMLLAPPITIKANIDIYDSTLKHEAIMRWVNNLNAPLNLTIKVGAKIMFVTNKWGEYYNGERGEVLHIEQNGNEVGNIIIKKTNNEIVSIKRHTFSLSEFVSQEDEVIEDVRASFLQFPFKLAYALTIHKSQGMSIDKLTCNLDNIFANGQLYVALSRATLPENLSLVYTRAREFNEYLRHVVRIDPAVREFYEKTNFIKEK